MKKQGQERIVGTADEMKVRADKGGGDSEIESWRGMRVPGQGGEQT